MQLGVKNKWCQQLEWLEATVSQRAAEKLYGFIVSEKLNTNS